MVSCGAVGVGAGGVGVVTFVGAVLEDVIIVFVTWLLLVMVRGWQMVSTLLYDALIIPMALVCDTSLELWYASHAMQSLSMLFTMSALCCSWLIHRKCSRRSSWCAPGAWFDAGIKRKSSLKRIGHLI